MPNNLILAISFGFKLNSNLKYASLIRMRFGPGPRVRKAIGIDGRADSTSDSESVGMGSIEVFFVFFFFLR